MSDAKDRDEQIPLFGPGARPERRRIRQPDPLFDALCFVTKTSASHLTVSNRGMLNRALKELRTVGATPEDILKRSQVYVERFRQTPTPGALVRHWASLSESPVAVRRVAREVTPLVSPERRSEIAQRLRAWLENH